jgi:hypothetical protein
MCGSIALQSAGQLENQHWEGIRMQVWSKCTAEVYYFDAEPAALEKEKYIVRLSDEIIEVVYDDDDGHPVCYRGINNGDGHFNLLAAECDGKATLHRFPGSEYLEGYWREGGEKGMWRIRLGILNEI